jgi:hypothetical protein
MSLLYFNGFDFMDYETLFSQAYYLSSIVPYSSTRYSYGHSISNSSSASSCAAHFIFHPDPDTGTGSNYIIVGWAFKNTDSTISYQRGVSLFYGVTGGIQCVLRHDSYGQIALLRGEYDGTTIDSAPAALNVGDWNYIEMKLACTNSSDYEVRVDGETVMSGSGVDLQYQANPGASKITFRGGYGGTYGCLWDDLYICDDQGSKNNDFLGEARVRTLLPSGAGTYTQWTPSAGSNYENVDETDPDEDTTYNETGVLDNQDSFAMGNLPDSDVDVIGVRSRVVARKEGAGYRALKNFVIVNSSKYDEVKDTLNLDYNVYEGSVLEDNPDDSQDWEVADIDAMEVGYQLAAVQSTTTTTV